MLNAEQLENAANESLNLVRALSEHKLKRCPYTTFKIRRDPRPAPVASKKAAAGEEFVGKLVTNFLSGKNATVLRKIGETFQLLWEQGGRSFVSAEKLANEFSL